MEQRDNLPDKALPSRCDLHTHSVFSDGTYTPSEIIAEAKHLGLIIALTDHNTVEGLPEFMEKAHELGVTAVPGTELKSTRRIELPRVMP